MLTANGSNADRLCQGYTLAYVASLPTYFKASSTFLCMLQRSLPSVTDAQHGMGVWASESEPSVASVHRSRLCPLPRKTKYLEPLARIGDF